MSRLAGRVALVTGAGGKESIGRAVAIALAEEGADLSINDLPSQSESLKKLVAEIEAMGRKALPIPGSVADVKSCHQMIDDTIRHFGRLDVLVNNAGGGEDVEFLDTEERDYHEKLDVNLKGPFFLTQAAVRHMHEQGGGKVVNISSEMAYIGEPTAIPYTMAKGAIRTMTKAIALAVAPTIQVNAVAPGPTTSASFKASHEFTDEVRNGLPLKRFVEPYEVARSVVFLASADGDCFTGQTLDPNSGAVMR